MRAMAKGSLFLVVIVMVGALLTGCKTTYSHDFIDNQTFLDDEGVRGSPVAPIIASPQKAACFSKIWPFQPPVAFKGDFECTFEFEIELPKFLNTRIMWVLHILHGRWQCQLHRPATQALLQSTSTFLPQGTALGKAQIR